MKFNGIIKYTIIIVWMFAASGCGVTRHLPADSYMLVRSDIVPDRNAPRDERIPAGQLNRYIPQSPTKRFFGTNLPAWIYLQADPDSESGWNQFLRRVGSEPVILDTNLTAVGNRNLKLYMDSRGFYDSESEYEIRYNHKRDRAKVTYTVTQGIPLRIRDISYDFRDDFLEQVIKSDNSPSLIAPGDIFDANALRDERQRLSDMLQNKGYFNFSVSNIRFSADTTVGDHKADITMIVEQRLVGRDDAGNPILENNAVYSLRNIFVVPDYDADRAAIDPSYWHKLDTTSYRGLKILSDGKPKLRPSALRQAINIYSDYPYRLQDVQRTYNDLLRMSFLKSARIMFNEVETEKDDEVVTYVGHEGEDASNLVETYQKRLDGFIFCTPGMRQGFTADFEGTATSLFYGLKSSVTYTNRNLFRGAELFNIGVSGGYEFYHGQDINDAYEFGVSAAIAFPRFVAPFPLDRANKLTNPQTKIEMSVNLQNRPFYHRTITSGNISYSWTDGRYNSYSLRPLSLSVIKVSYLDEDFINGINNIFLEKSYRDQLIPAVSASYRHFNPDNRNGNSLDFRMNLEAAGNITQFLASMFSNKVTRPVEEDTPDITESFYELFGIRFAQYFRTEASIANGITLGENLSFVYRFLGGIGLPYGNNPSLPLDRQFYSGGGSSMRGWVVRTLGLGGQLESDRPNYGTSRYYPIQTGNMKLEANVELRFPVWNSFHGAVFFDAGNIWNVNIKGSSDDDPTIFRVEDFIPQLGLNTGLGVRYDISVAVIRLDWGIKLHNPNLPQGERWVRHFRLGDTVLNFSIGYPF